MKSKLIPLAAVLATVSAANASILIQELFDGVAADSTLNGAADTDTSIGLTGVWTTNVSQDIYTASDFDVDGVTLPGLPSNDGASGRVLWRNVTNNWDRGIYATRPLTVPIDFGVDRVIYFSVRLNNPGDTGMGVGLASGDAAADSFIGAGFTWNNAQPLSAPTSNIAGNSSYISHGVLDGTVDSGVYGIRAYDARNSINTFGLLVGRITINAVGDDVIHIKRYSQNAVIDNNLDAITWSTFSTLDSSMVASHLVLWMNGAGEGELDAVRFGDTWTDVTGVTLAGEGQPTLSGSSVASITGNSALASTTLFNSAADVTLYWDTADQGMGPWANSNPLGNQEVGPVSGTLSGLSPDTVYFYRFHAVNSNPDPDLEAWGESGLSFATAPTGLAVNDLEGSPFSPYEVDLFWTDTFQTETGYMIERSPAGSGVWATVGTTPADTDFYTDQVSGLEPNTSYDYRITATNDAGSSDASNVVTVTTPGGDPLETMLLVNFDGTLDGTVYTPGPGEIDVTNTFKSNGTPSLSGGLATLNPGNENGPDGFDINPAILGSLVTQNWVAEVLLTYQSTGAGGEGTTPVLIDVLGDCNLRLRDEADNNVLQMFYWNGSSAQQQFAPLPPSGTKVHIAYAWDAGAGTLTGYVNGVSFGSSNGGPFATPDSTNVSFGYFGRNGFTGRGIDGVLDAVAFQTGTATFNPTNDFLILPDTQSFAEWIGGFAVGALDGFDDDADGDGLDNGVEAFLGTDPSLPNGGSISDVTTNGTVTIFHHPQASPALGDVTGFYEWSLDLGTWYVGDGIQGPGGGMTVSIPTVSPVGGTSTVTATSSGLFEKLFIRVSAEN